MHPSRNRLLWIGVFTFFGHPTFTWIWGSWLKQPYENAWVRACMALISLMYLLPAITRDPASRQSGWIFGLATWIQLPCFFTWMFFMNGSNPVWLASMSAMILIYFHATDWRLALTGLLTGCLVGCLLAGHAVHSADLEQEHAAHLVVFAFSVGMGLMLGMSSANLRRTRLLNTLSTMGVMAHELRTPLATVNLMGDVLRNLAQSEGPDASKRKKMEELAARLQNLVRNMNRQIDTQISNAQLLRLPSEQSVIAAREWVLSVVAEYPYRSSRERDCVQVQIAQDFSFVGSRPLFSQVLSNLLKNALHSLAASRNAPIPGDLRIDVGVHRGKGRLAMTDKGLGIPHEQQQRIFEPFFSTQSGAGSGLGLTFCKNVVEAAHGVLSVHSEPDEGAVFMIDLPLHKEQSTP